MYIPSDRTKAKRILSRVYLLVFYVWVSLPAPAQDNPYKIDNALYPIYQRAVKLSRQPEGLAVADTLYRKAVELGDKKAQCLAYTIPLQYSGAQDNDAQMEEAAENLKKISRANGYLQYYYHAWNNEIIYFLNHDHSLIALQKAEKMKEHAFADHDDYGIWSCIRSMGHIYRSRGNHALSVKYYEEALDYMLENLPEQDPTQIYISLAECYRLRKEYDTALGYSLKGVKASKTGRTRVIALAEKCINLFHLKRTGEFDTCYKETMKLSESLGMEHSRSMEMLNIFKCTQERKYEEAHLRADKMQNDTPLFHAIVYEAEGDYPNAIKQLKRMQAERDSANALIQANDIAELNAQIGIERMKTENIHAEAHYHAMLYAIFIGFLLLFILFLLLYLQRKRKANRELQRKNEELDRARKQAEAARRMQTLFLRNMHHEIRTPLNSIVGFSQILTSPETDLTAEEKQEFSDLISHNADLLLTLVSDILDTAELESGNLIMRHTSCLLNSLCREAIASVECRCPEGVKLCTTSDAADDYRLLTDGQRVRQVLVNLLTNAEKYTEKGEIRLHCSLTEHPGCVTFSVTDTGTGIPPQHAEDIFERFRQLDDFHQGTGLGLNICRLIAERLHGEVYLDKEYTGGARFVFVVPIEKKEQP